MEKDCTAGDSGFCGLRNIEPEITFGVGREEVLHARDVVRDTSPTVNAKEFFGKTGLGPAHPNRHILAVTID